MNRFTLSSTILVASLFSISVLASPKSFLTHNLSNTTTNVTVDGREGPNPTPPGETSKVGWFVVKAGCAKHKDEGVCPAVIKMNIESDTPTEVGIIHIDLDSGMITPSQMVGNGYVVVANGPGEITITTE